MMRSNLPTFSRRRGRTRRRARESPSGDHLGGGDHGQGAEPRPRHLEQVGEATTAWTPADGGVGRDWARCYGVPSDEGKSVGAPPCSVEPAGGERTGIRARARLNLGGCRQRHSGHCGGWGYGERDGRVWMTYGRERERKGSRERPRAALYSEAMAHRGRGLRASAEMAVVATGGGLGLSAALVGVA